MELGKTYDPKAAEERWFQTWIDLGYFRADPKRQGPVFSMVIPPPNVTGQLHLGHALNATLHDVIVRMRRMQGYNTLWLPGTDHAGIATQNAVEKDLAKDGRNRHQLGRDKFLDRVWQWREEKGGRILQQLRRLGASCDWSRERFTLDAGLSRAVSKVFVELFKRGLIYRDRKLINWCPRCESALSDLEVDHKEVPSSLWFIRYPFADGNGSLTVATTRPETMLGDTAVAVGPGDERYRAIVGKTLRLPLIGREIEVIADPAVDPKFGTGAVKVTPGHDINDFEIGRRHGLEQISVMDTQGRMNENAGIYRGLRRDAARTQIVADLRAQGLLEKTEPHRSSVGTCSRCDTVVEPMLSEQWFVRVSEMAQRAMAAVRDGRTTFYPERYKKDFFEWMENIHDWCISRQLWWGHRIPAFRCERCNHLTVAAERPPKCEECGGTDLVQDEDVLDTWFSSGLWPFSTLGWPDETPELRKYYPTSLLITGFDIIFFWVARMMMLGLEFMDDVPFRDVYITTLVRDEYGKKMTKSKGNVVDPLDLMNQYGTDAVRLTLAQLATQKGDITLSHERFAAARAFANKVWNAARFAMMNLDGAPRPLPSPGSAQLSLAERWILGRLDAMVREVTRAVDAYEFNLAAMAAYTFIWHEFCDWYIELSKEPLKAGGQRQAQARWVLVTCFDRMLRVLHPFMPFISEEIWQVLRPYLSEQNLSQHLAVAKFPDAFSESWMNTAETAAMDHGIAATEAINSLRSLLGYHPGQRVRAVIRAAANVNLSSEFAIWKPYALTMAKAESVELFASKETLPGGAVTAVLPWGEIAVLAPDGFDFAKALAVARKKLDEVAAHHRQHLARLNNPEFQAKAAPQMQEQIRERAAELESQSRLLSEQVRQFERASE
ncbi:MAG TPA: valine--tRNA ligase [Candidatus Binataceae bacterium]|nr:valine--tRNA ligase [Candidatus Binataceae bacterium]